MRWHALPISGDTYRKCNDMCMLSCNDGYTLSTTTDETGWHSDVRMRGFRAV
ncbi:hypothetical protein DPMN_003495 [Dreissena polymorpha]|uniref:Uncharacterized protein n=1 Tax=Dreissena polymorpha TaxID=45954 RepID=A0A9D4RTN7_DREPO|nr:hypothetical protein DPMN_002196 [Dreissena polymorpha]KAH3879590.1 hypothetical protein DPMN_003495 [Dreissena polymorpha]